MIRVKNRWGCLYLVTICRECRTGKESRGCNIPGPLRLAWQPLRLAWDNFDCFVRNFFTLYWTCKNLVLYFLIRIDLIIWLTEIDKSFLLWDILLKTACACNQRFGKLFFVLQWSGCNQMSFRNRVTRFPWEISMKASCACEHCISLPPGSVMTLINNVPSMLSNV